MGELSGFDLNLKCAKIILRRLEHEEERWTPLMKAVLKDSPTPWRAQSILTWLLKQGYVERPRRGVYHITDKGRKLLETI